MVLKEYFTDKELNCNCGCGLLPPYESLERLYLLRLLCGFPLYINSAARCKNYNPKVGGKEGSTHLPEWDRELDSLEVKVDVDLISEMIEK